MSGLKFEYGQPPKRSLEPGIFWPKPLACELHGPFRKPGRLIEVVLVDEFGDARMQCLQLVSLLRPRRQAKKSEIKGDGSGRTKPRPASNSRHPATSPSIPVHLRVCKDARNLDP